MAIYQFWEACFNPCDGRGRYADLRGVRADSTNKQLISLALQALNLEGVTTGAIEDISDDAAWALKMPVKRRSELVGYLYVQHEFNN